MSWRPTSGESHAGKCAKLPDGVPGGLFRSSTLGRALLLVFGFPSRLSAPGGQCEYDDGSATPSVRIGSHVLALVYIAESIRAGGTGA